MAITHDRYFLDNVAGWILELDRGEGIPWEGNYSLTAGAKIGVWRRKRLPKRRAVNPIEELEWVRVRARGRQSKVRRVWLALKN